MLISSIGVLIYWTFLFYLDKLTWYFNLGLGLGAITFLAWLACSYHVKAEENTIGIHYGVNLLFNIYVYLILWQTNMDPTYLMLSILVISISGTTFSHFRWLVSFYTLAAFSTLFLPETQNIETKWFFVIAVFLIGVITGLQFKKRLQSLELLSTTYKRFSQISEGHYGGILIFKENKIIEVNATLKHIFGLEQIIDTQSISLSDLLGPDAHLEIKSIVSKNGETLNHKGELAIQGKFRPTFYVEYSLRKIQMLEGPSVAMFFKDVSELKHSQDIISEQADTLKKVSRLSDLGELSAGIAHEINNPLAIISGMADEILFTLESGDQPDKKQLLFLANKVIQNTERITKIIKGLKTFVRDGSSDPFKPDNIEHILKEAVDICETSLAKQSINLKLSGVKEDTHTMIKCRSVQIEQVLVNIINNAKDAIIEQESPWIEVGLKQTQTKVIVEITDSGYGIPIQEQNRIFDSYYTTKSAGHGTGLGLSIAKQIIEEHDGSIEIDPNSPNTSFVITLPIYKNSKDDELNLKT